MMVEYAEGPKSLSEWSVIKLGYDHHGALRAQFMRRFPEDYRDLMELKREASASRSYVKGRQFEWRVRDHYKDAGYVVARSAHSRGPFDLVAIGQHEVCLIQCKTNGKIGKADIAELVTLAAGVNARPILAWREAKAPYSLRLDVLP